MTTFPNATRGAVYPSVFVQRYGGRPPYAWTLSAGALPTGLTLSGNGFVSGTCDAAAALGAYNFTVRLTDALGRIAEKAFTLTVDASYIFIGHDGANVDLQKLAAGTGAIMATYTPPRRSWAGCFDGAYIWTISLENTPNDRMYKINPVDGTVMLTINSFYGAGWDRPSGICSDGTNIYAVVSTAAGVGKLCQFASDGTPGWVADVDDADPYRPCYDSLTNSIWVPRLNAGSIRKIRISDGTVLGSYAGPAKACGCCFDGTHIWVVGENSASVRELNASDGSFVRDVATGGATPLHSCCFTGSEVLAASRGDGKIYRINADTGALIGSYDSGGGVNNLSDISSAFDGAYVWLVQTTANTVKKMHVSDGTIIGTYAVSSAPNFAASTNRCLPWPHI